ncbi:hypothetical protein IFM89_036283 [Coptis chinensis]|uniref:Uncharacterized protein n=1 Tax=Coptis chinensis TaxID=261450 RepID=A0A835M5P6_9MAGN|nr:hypothetical protein IFM89_036283 [Coptis chinensis]
MSSPSDQIVWKRSKAGQKEMMKETNNHHLHDHHYSSSKCKTEKKKASEATKRHSELVSYRALPEYMKDNEYILDYYRANWPLKAALYSLFRWHNETINVWTIYGVRMVDGNEFDAFTTNLGSPKQIYQVCVDSSLQRSFSVAQAMNVSHNSEDLYLATAALINLTERTPTEMLATASDMLASRWPFFVFLGGSMFCLLTSSTCHLFCCHSHHLNLLLLRFDYAGIAVMIVTSFFPPIFYIFQCNPVWQVVYLTGITTIGIFTVITLLTPSHSSKECRPFRALLFFLMGFSGIVPAIHALIVNWSEPRRFIALAYESAMALSYAVGTLFYVSRIPERWKPGLFDLAGHSHQIFHIFVILGALAHYGAALLFIDWRDTVGCSL